MTRRLRRTEACQPPELGDIARGAMKRSSKGSKRGLFVDGSAFPIVITAPLRVKLWSGACLLISVRTPSILNIRSLAPAYTWDRIDAPSDLERIFGQFSRDIVGDWGAQQMKQFLTRYSVARERIDVVEIIARLSSRTLK